MPLHRHPGTPRRAYPGSRWPCPGHYGPRLYGRGDDQEIALVLDLIGQSHAFASGKIGSHAKPE
jgi:hypothetical protein